MQILLYVALSVHMLAAVGWIAPAIGFALNGGKRGENWFREQMIAALLAFLSGGYLWHLFYGSTFGGPQKILAVGVVAAIVAAGVQGALLGPARRRLAQGRLTEALARPRIAIAYKIAAGLLMGTVICMVMARGG